MWAKNFPVKYAVPFTERGEQQFYLWFSPTQALERVSSVELTSVYPYGGYVVATHVSRAKLEETVYPDTFFVGVGEKWSRYDDTITLSGFPSNPDATHAATLQYLNRVVTEAPESEFKQACAAAMKAYSDSSKALETSA
jgi:hypothetical protein